MTTQNDINELRRLSDKADKAPWSANTGEEYDCTIWGNVPNRDDFIANIDQVSNSGVPCFDASIANAQLIVAMRNHLPKLLAAWEEKEKLRAQMKSMMDAYNVRYEESQKAQKQLATASAEIANLKAHLATFADRTTAAIARAERWKAVARDLHIMCDNPKECEYHALLASEAQKGDAS